MSLLGIILRAEEWCFSTGKKELQDVICSHALPAMPYDPGAQGVPLPLHSDELVAPDEAGQGDASSEIAGFPNPPARGGAISSWWGGGVGDGAASCLARATARRALEHGWRGLPERFILAFITYFKLLAYALTHAHKLARVMRVTSTNCYPARLSCPEFTFTTSQGTPPNIWTEWPAPVELEYVPAMHAMHAEDPAKSPPRVTCS
jgi:hypothetical protein